MFLVHTTDTGAAQPWEYLPAKAGTYQVGQLVNAADGQIAPLTAASKTTPGYVCMGDVTVEDGGVLPVTRVQHTAVYETLLSVETAGAAVGAKLEVSADGLGVDGAAAGTFEVVYAQGTEAGATVRGRFA